ncbi:MAG: hypothetical protein ACP5DC_05145 [Halothiobacillaceae bacterium]
MSLMFMVRASEGGSRRAPAAKYGGGSTPIGLITQDQFFAIGFFSSSILGRYSVKLEQTPGQPTNMQGFESIMETTYCAVAGKPRTWRPWVKKILSSQLDTKIT